MLKKGLLFFTTLVTMLCLISLEADARNLLTLKRGLKILGIIADKPSRMMPSIIDRYSYNRSEYSIEEVFRSIEGHPIDGRSSTEKEIDELLERMSSDNKISVKEFFKSRVPEPSVESTFDDQELIIGLIARSDNEDFLYLSPDKFARTYRSIGRNDDCKAGGLCLTAGKVPEASFSVQCGNSSITVSTNGSLSISFDGYSSSISMNAGLNQSK